MDSGAAARPPRVRRWVSTSLLALAPAFAFPPGGVAQADAPPADGPASTCPLPASLVGGLEQPRAAVRYLADEELEGRLSGSPGEWCAADYIAAEFERIGLVPGGRDGWYQEVPLASALDPHAPEGTGRNVIGLLPGAHPDLAVEALVVGAHHDHLGRGTVGSLEPGSAEVHTGADDNASGVAALLAVAERLARAPPARTVVFAAFTGEEQGLLGSTRYVESPAVPLERTVAMINLDMVGRLEEDPLLVYGVGTAAEWEAWIERASEGLDLEFALHPSGYGPSDHTSFYLRDIPVLHFFTNVHTDYHRPTDRWERVDYEGLDRVAELVGRLALTVADRPERPTLVAGAGTPRRAGQASGERGAAAWLGTVPDFGSAEEGVRISGVTGGSPAEAAGLRGGDTILRLGEHAIADLYDLTEALRSHAPGDRVGVEVRRDGETLALEVVLGSRQELER